MPRMKWSHRRRSSLSRAMPGRSGAARSRPNEPDGGERDHLGFLLAFLRDRRALYGRGELLTREDIRVSAAKIVSSCASYIEALPQGSAAAKPAQRILSACRQFMGLAESARDVEFYVALGTLRGTVAEPIAQLAALYTTELTRPLAMTPPSEDNCGAT